MNTIVDLTDVNFDRAIAAARVVVDFYTPWCGPRKALRSGWVSLPPVRRAA